MPAALMIPVTLYFCFRITLATERTSSADETSQFIDSNANALDGSRVTERSPDRVRVRINRLKESPPDNNNNIVFSHGNQTPSTHDEDDTAAANTVLFED